MGLQACKQRLIVMLEIEIFQPQLGVFDCDLRRDATCQTNALPWHRTPAKCLCLPTLVSWCLGPPRVLCQPPPRRGPGRLLGAQGGYLPVLLGHHVEVWLLFSPNRGLGHLVEAVKLIVCLF